MQESTYYVSCSIQAEIYITTVGGGGWRYEEEKTHKNNHHKKSHISLSDCGSAYIYVQIYPYSWQTKQGIPIQEKKLQVTAILESIIYFTKFRLLLLGWK